MSAIFDAYAAYYDLLYRDKDYRDETAYVARKLRHHGPTVRTILEFGSGTGGHAMYLAEAGFSVSGVDQSQGMIDAARRRGAALPERNRPDFTFGDIRSCRLKRSFDAVIALFHVMSYQTGAADLRDTMASARAHLVQGGVFFFDCWYGPGVLTDLPANRVKRLQDDRIELTRIAEPLLIPNENVVEVRYDVFVRDRADGQMHEIRESHRMRYLFVPEVEVQLNAAGFEMVEALDWMGDGPPTERSWLACFVARAV